MLILRNSIDGKAPATEGNPWSSSGSLPQNCKGAHGRRLSRAAEEGDGGDGIFVLDYSEEEGRL